MLSKFSGTALILITRSRSSALSRLILARLLIISPGNQPCKSVAYLFWNQTWTCLGLNPGISRDSRSRWAASGCGCLTNSLMRNLVCWWVSLGIVSHGNLHVEGSKPT